MKHYKILYHILLIIGIIYIIKSFATYEGFITSESDVPTVKFPFKNLYDQDGNKLNVILIAAPFREKAHETLYAEYKEKGLQFAGISSYLEFPGKIANPYEDRYHEKQTHDYESMVSTWLHCFREPRNYLRTQMPNILLTEADLKDFDAYKPNTDIAKSYDFIYVCLKDNDKCDPGWQSYNRNWDLAKKCLEIMCKKYKLRGLIIGRENCPITEFCDGIVKILPFLPYDKFQEEMQKCRFLFVPNVSDASPRVITEALCYNIPVLVNSNIIGGWHNVIPHITGEFFTNEDDLIEALDWMLPHFQEYQARNWFMENRGKKRCGAYLAQFLKLHYPQLNNKELEYATITI